MSVLYTSADEKNYVVTSVPNNHLLQTLGVFVGSTITKKFTYSNGGPVLVTIDGREVAIGKDIAVEILV